MLTDFYPSLYSAIHTRVYYSNASMDNIWNRVTILMRFIERDSAGSISGVLWLLSCHDARLYNIREKASEPHSSQLIMVIIKKAKTISKKLYLSSKV